MHQGFQKSIYVQLSSLSYCSWPYFLHLQLFPNRRVIRRCSFLFKKISSMYFTQQLISNLGRPFVFNPFCSEWCMLINNTCKQVFPRVPHFIWVIVRCNAFSAKSCEGLAKIQLQYNFWAVRLPLFYANWHNFACKININIFELTHKYT